jgi:hypothetical protein
LKFFPLALQKMERKVKKIHGVCKKSQPDAT